MSQESHTSLVKLEIVADSLTTTQSVSKGEIDQLKVIASSEDATILGIQVSNVDNLSAMFSLRLTGCSSVKVSPNRELRFSVGGLKTKFLNLTLSVVSDATETNIHTCTVTLVDSTAAFLGAKNVTFHQEPQKAQQNTELVLNGDSLVTSAAQQAQQDACESCKGISDIACLLLRACWSHLFQYFILITFMFIAGYLTIAKCLPCKILKCLFIQLKCCFKCTRKGFK